jgi:four helix bundle protein
MPIRTHKELKIWQKAHDLVIKIYRVTTALPREELYGLTSQLRRAATSVPTNIVEGMGRRTTNDLVHFLYTARGSAKEAQYLCELAGSLGFLSSEIAEEISIEYDGLNAGIHAMIKKLKLRQHR